jgi:FAD:protein FMN transferase
MPWSKCILAGLLWAALTATSTATPELTAHLFHKNKYIMGTEFEIAVYESSSGQGAQAVEQALEEIARLDDVMSNYKAESELSRLNRTAHFRAQAVSPDLYRVIEESLRYSRLSGGKFDVTVGPLVDRWKAVLGGAPVPSSAEQNKLRSCVGFEKIELIPPNQIEFHSPCLQVDLGAIGKGYAVDRAVEILRKREIKSALIDAGGSTFYGIGAPPGQVGWLVHLRDPSNKIDPRVLLCENSVSTSEQTPKSLLGNEFAGHIIDPENASPLRTRYALSAVAKTGTASDALSTTLLLVGHEKGKGMVEGLADVAAIWVSTEGQTEVATSGPRILTGGNSRGDPFVTGSAEKMFMEED